MRTVYKYPVHFEMTVTPLPLGADLVHFAAQQGDFFIWCEIDTDEVEVDRTRKFCVVGTGHKIPETATHRATVLSGIYVWHLYEVQS